VWGWDRGLLGRLELRVGERLERMLGDMRIPGIPGISGGGEGFARLICIQAVGMSTTVSGEEKARNRDIQAGVVLVYRSRKTGVQVFESKNFGVCNAFSCKTDRSPRNLALEKRSSNSGAECLKYSCINERGVF